MTDLNKINQNYYLRKEKEYYDKKEKSNINYTIPFLKDKEITLSNAGNLTNAVLSTNMLDSIAKYAELANLPLFEAIGLAAQETTFGNRIRINGKSYQDNLRKDMTPVELVSDWEYRRSPLKYLNNKAFNYSSDKSKDIVKKSFDYSMGSLTNPSFSFEKRERLSRKADLTEAINYNNFIKSHKKDFINAENYYIDEPPLLHAFKYYKEGKYNPLDPSHTLMVRDKGKKALSSPQIQKWLKDRK